MLKQVLYAEKEGSQSMLIAGSGTMGWDAVGANLIEKGDEAVRICSVWYKRERIVLCRCRDA